MTVVNRSFGLDAFGRCSPGGDPREPPGPDTSCKSGPLSPRRTSRPCICNCSTSSSHQSQLCHVEALAQGTHAGLFAARTGFTVKMSRDPGVGVLSARRCRTISPTLEALNCGDASLLLVLFRGVEVGRLIAIGRLILDACPVWYAHGFLLRLRRTRSWGLGGQGNARLKFRPSSSARQLY
jgi:hypothetical protein